MNKSCQLLDCLVFLLPLWFSCYQLAEPPREEESSDSCPVSRKWKDLVDEWVKSNSHETATPSIITDGDSPQQIQARAGQSRNQVPDFGYSPNTHTVYQTSSDINGGLGSDKPNREVVEPKAKAAPPPRKEAPTKPNHPPSPAPPAQKAEQCREHKDSLLDPERLASARRRLHENYQEAQNAKKQRTIQVMDIHDIPRPKNSFFRGVPGQATVKRKG
uniref:Uncharacterized protein n=1 Tax=Anthurium amnicola TaxID=1678845 RepID=A0A1D1XNW9_9ARAE